MFQVYIHGLHLMSLHQEFILHYATRSGRFDSKLLSVVQYYPMLFTPCSFYCKQHVIGKEILPAKIYLVLARFIQNLFDFQLSV